jgi:hypothetical protein
MPILHAHETAHAIVTHQGVVHTHVMEGCSLAPGVQRTCASIVRSAMRGVSPWHSRLCQGCDLRGGTSSHALPPMPAVGQEGVEAAAVCLVHAGTRTAFLHAKGEIPTDVQVAAPERFPACTAFATASRSTMVPWLVLIIEGEHRSVIICIDRRGAVLLARWQAAAAHMRLQLPRRSAGDQRTCCAFLLRKVRWHSLANGTCDTLSIAAEL